MRAQLKLCICCCCCCCCCCFDRFRRCGHVGFFVIAFIVVCDYLLLQLLEFLNPADRIERAADVSSYARSGRRRQMARHK